MGLKFFWFFTSGESGRGDGLQLLEMPLLDGWTLLCPSGKWEASPQRAGPAHYVCTLGVLVWDLLIQS